MVKALNISESHRFILWAPPRCGARYTGQVLKQLGLIAGCPRERENAISHSIELPPSPEYCVVLLVRNPFTRLLSSWGWANLLEKNIYPDFKEFVLLNRGRWCYPISKMLGARSGWVDYILHLEQLADDIRRLPFCDKELRFPSPDPYLSDYRKQGKTAEEFYDQELREFVAERYAGDFLLGSYDSAASF